MTGQEIKTVTLTSHKSVRNVVYSSFNSFPPGFEIRNEKNAVIIAVST